MKLKALMVLAVCMALPVQARRVYIYGRVTDEAGQPVELATVNEELTLHSAMTNLKGEYSFNVNTPRDAQAHASQSARYRTAGHHAPHFKLHP